MVKSNLKIRLPEIGLALTLIGVPLGMYANYLLALNFLSECLMVLSIFFISTGLKKSINKINNTFFLILFMHFVFIFYLVFSGDNTYVYMHIFVIVFQVVLLFLDFKKINFDYFINFLVVISSVLSLLGAYYIFDGRVVGEEAWIERQSSENYTLEIFTISYGMVVNFTTILYFIVQGRLNKFYNTFLTFILFFDLYGVIFGYKRSPLICIILISLLWFIYFFRRIDNIKLIKFIILLPIAIFVFIFLFYDKFVLLLKNVYVGVMTLFGLSSIGDETGSSSFRVGLRENAFEIINDFGIINYVFGYGYMTSWLDNPLLQSFLDLGILGFIFYLFVIIIYPVKIYLSKSSDPKFLLFFTYCIYALITSMNSGHQYMSIKYIPVIIMCCFVFYIKRNRLN